MNEGMCCFPEQVQAWTLVLQWAHLRGTGHILGQQVSRWIQKGLTWDIPTVTPHPMAVGARGGPCSTHTPLFSLFGGEGQKNWQLLMGFEGAEICWGHMSSLS